MAPVGLADLAIGALGVWRITHLLHAEDGPFDLAATLRRRAAGGFLGKAMACFLCLSLWVALPVSLLLGAGLPRLLLLWPALSGAASLLELAVRRDDFTGYIHEEPPPPHT